jgi:HEAT repeat protein
VEGFAGLLVFGIVGSVAFLLVAQRNRARARVWREAARAVGLAEVREAEALGIWRTLTGTASGLRVRLERYQRGRHESGTRVTVGPLGHGPYGFALRREGFGTSVEKALGEREIEIGDGAFDEDLYVQGHPPLARALLDSQTRRDLRTLFRGEAWSGRPSDVRARISGDLLRVEIRERPFQAPPPLSDALARIMEVSRRLAAPSDVAARLGTNLSEEPEPRVRLECLLALVHEFPDHPATRTALLAARTDASEEVRLRAGAALGPEGRACLVDLASDDAAGDSCAARAVNALGEHLERARAEEILLRALRRRRVAPALACLETLGRWGGEEAVPCLAKVLGAEMGEIGVVAARALGATGAAAAEGPLVEVLAGGAGEWPGSATRVPGATGDEVPERPLAAGLAAAGVELQVAAARALGRVGSVSAVPALRDAAERSRDHELRRAVRQAVAEIQSRLRGAAPGQLSLAEAEGGAGRLSLVEEDVEGRVSLAEGEEPAPVAEPPRGRGREPA